MGRQLSPVAYQIIFYNNTGKIIKRIKRSVKGVLNNGVIRKIAKEEGITFDYWVSEKAS